MDNYANLAELYKCSKDLEKGDLVQISNTDKYDMEHCTCFKNCVGVISRNPALKMNCDILHFKEEYESECCKILPIGYTGILEIKIDGKINKGDNIELSSTKGIGIKSNIISKMKALENKETEDASLVKCLVQMFSSNVSVC